MIVAPADSARMDFNETMEDFSPRCMSIAASLRLKRNFAGGDTDD